MKGREHMQCAKRIFVCLLSLAMSISGIGYVPAAETIAEAAGSQIEISSAAELKKIGNDSSYPMDGDYVLTADIDLSGENWTPIGGATGSEYGLVSGERVFSGTFDGQGYTISGLTITYDGSSGAQFTSQSGLFAMIGSDSSSDYAEVKNINFTDVSITHTLGSGDTIGTLAGDANGYVKIDNIAVLGGSITVKGSSGDLIGVGGVVGQVRQNNTAVEMSNLYNAASVTVESGVNTSYVRCGGILGRIHQNSLIGSLTACLNVGTVTWKGSSGYAINGYSASTDAASNTGNITNCYYLEGTGNDFGASTKITDSELGSAEVAAALGADYWEVYNGKILPVISEGKVVTPIPSPVFADGDSISSVTQDFTLPLSYTPETEEESITWTSSDTSVISISGSTATVSGVIADTQVTLTATTQSGRTKTFELTVVSDLELVLDQDYAKVGTRMTASVDNAPSDATFTYQWTKDGTVLSSSSSYTPVQDDLNEFLTVTATLVGSLNATLEKTIYCSKLPVVYIDTADGNGITSKTEYKDATMTIQGNDTYNSGTTTLYDGGISIRGRGNSTWNMSYSKLPYKIKLDTKTDLFGFGTSKHWTLLANYMDESLIRNTSSYDLSGEMGMLYLQSTHVDVVLNGVYAGNYQLVGNVRIEESRADIYDWEELAEDAAKAIGKAEGITGDDRDALEDYLNENMGWITSGSFTYLGTTYNISDYNIDIPTNEDGTVNVSGGFLFELDEYYDEASKFRTTYNQPIMFKSPEFVSTNSDLFNYAQQYIQAVEDSVHSTDFYVTVTKESSSSNASNFTEDYEGSQHYTDLVDMDSLVNYFVLNEFYWNTETMKKSTYMYKDLDGKLYIGPVWDMDWTSNSLISSGETGYPTLWMTTTRSSNAQAEQWYKYLIGDPYFVTKVYECYLENRDNFEYIVEDGGVIDQEQEYLAESAQANYEAGYVYHSSTFETETERLRTFLTERLEWLDDQFTSVDALLNSLGKYSSSSSISVTADTTGMASTTYTAKVTSSSVSKVGFYINGILRGTVDVTNGTATLTIDDSNLERESGKLNVVQVRGMNSSGSLISSGGVNVNNYTIFTKDIPADELSGTVTISGTATVGATLTAMLADTNNSGTLRYQWYADGTAISGATASTYKLTSAEVGKTITVVVTSSIETGSLTSAATATVTDDTEVTVDHLIINQVYGGGNNDSTPVTHSFIEIYNPTNQEISLSGYSIGYLSNGKNGTAETEVTLALDSTKSIPAHTSYLIRCEAQDDSTPELITLSIDAYDQEWTQIIDNKQYRIILYNGEEKVDGVSVAEDAVEGEALASGTISKQRAIRRTNFADTDNNQADFVTVTYQNMDAATVSENRPRSLTDGAWGTDIDTGTGTETALEGILSIRGNAIVGAVLYADESSNNTGTLSYQWYADGELITGADGQFYVVDESCEGKTISVIVTSSVQTGAMSCKMDSAVTVKTAQTAHLIINQVYGTGGKSSPALSHSFIEIYNPTLNEISLDGYTVSYTSGGTTETFDLSGGVIPSHTSYLIRCGEGSEEYTYSIDGADAEWTSLEISNKQYSVVILNKGTQIDGVSVNESSVEGTPLTDPDGDTIISKNKAVRRISFIDTDSNVDDFEVLNYSKITEAILAAAMPRRSTDGVWGENLLPDPLEAVKKELSVTVSDAESTYPESESDSYTEESWAAFQSALENANKVLSDESSTVEQVQAALEALESAIRALEQISGSGDETSVPDSGHESGSATEMENTGGNANADTDANNADDKSAGAAQQTLSAPTITSVKSVIRSGNSNVAVKLSQVDGVTSYRVYRTVGSKTTLLGTTESGTYYDTKPVGGKATYLAEAVNGSTVSAKSAGVSITLPKATKKVTVKATTSGSKKAVTLSWKRVKGATKYMIFRSTKSGSGYKRIAVVKRGKTVTYTDKKVVKGKKYYYRVVAVKNKTYSPSKKSKAVKVK